MPKLTKILVVIVEIYKHMRENRPVDLWNSHLTKAVFKTNTNIGEGTQSTQLDCVFPALKMHAYAKQN